MIEYLPNSAPPEMDAVAVVVEFVDGPWAGRREERNDPPAVIDVNGGTYRRSVRCADDGAIRYVFEEDPIAIVHRRCMQPV